MGIRSDRSTGGAHLMRTGWRRLYHTVFLLCISTRAVLLGPGGILSATFLFTSTCLHLAGIPAVDGDTAGEQTLLRSGRFYLSPLPHALANA